MMNIHFGDLPTGIAAVGTAGTLAAALWQIRSERQARRRDEAEAEKRAERAQAELISAWYGGNDPTAAVTGKVYDRIVVLNRSDQPVYEVLISLVFIQGAAPQTGEDLVRLRERSHGSDPERHQVALAVLPPGQWRVRITGGWGGMHRMPGAEVAFNDRAGSAWVRRATGALDRLPAAPFDHFNMSRPVSFGVLDRDPSQR